MPPPEHANRTVSRPEHDTLWQFFAELAELAAAETLPRFRTALEITNKAAAGDFDPVTAADRSAEHALRAAIEARFPAHGIIGEEGEDKPTEGDYTWILDPVDGTRAFVCGMPTWGTLVGLLEAGRPCYGMMAQPFVGERFVGGNGRAALIRDGEVRELRCRPCEGLETATLFATTPEMFAPGTEADAFGALWSATRLTRFGADAYGYALLAAGFVDLVVESNLGFYDIAPLVPVVEAAGGIVSDWSGKAVRGGGQAIAAGDARVHAAALELLAPAAAN